MYLRIKRIVDIILSFFLIIILFPLFIIIYFLLIFFKIENPIFKQERSGKNAKKFIIYKFRTIDQKGNISLFCNFLRSTGLDEILQLINILKGDMSFVGPRPWIIEYEKNFTKKERGRLAVLPGLTGLAQISKCDNIFDKINKDLEYIENISFKTDFLILLNTFKLLLFGNKKDLSNTDIEKEIYLLSTKKRKR